MKLIDLNEITGGNSFIVLLKKADTSTFDDIACLGGVLKAPMVFLILSVKYTSHYHLQSPYMGVPFTMIIKQI